MGWLKKIIEDIRFSSRADKDILCSSCKDTWERRDKAFMRVGFLVFLMVVFIIFVYAIVRSFIN